MVNESRNQRSNPSGRLYGKQRAVVVNNIHPENLHLAQIRLLALWDEIADADLPWAEYQLQPGAGQGSGVNVCPYQKGAPVWVEFPYDGDTRAPLITGGAYVAPKGVSHLPDDLREPKYQHKRLGQAPAGPNASYGDLVTDLFGVLQQLTQSGDYCITHKPSGTAFHITKDGQMVLECANDGFRTTGGDLLEEVKGTLNIKVVGNAAVEAEKITFNGGEGVVTGAHICAYTGAKHSDCSSTVMAGK
jgi:hypothetical protein